MEEFYEKLANELIRRAEADTSVPLEEFYRGLKVTRDVIDERLQAAADELDPDVAEEILR